MFKHFLVPTDGSDLSNDAVRRAVEFAREIGAHITFFFAKPEYPIAFFGEGSLIESIPPEKFAELVDEQARGILATAENLASEAGVIFNSITTTSHIPYEAIINAANANGCDVIFMASHGRRGVSGLLLGSETHKVLTHTKIPVVVYR